MEVSSDQRYLNNNVKVTFIQELQRSYSLTGDTVSERVLSSGTSRDFFSGPHTKSEQAPIVLCSQEKVHFLKSERFKMLAFAFDSFITI